MWNIEEDTEHYNGRDGDSGSSHCVKSSCFMWFDYPVESVERHAEYEESTAQRGHPQDCVVLKYKTSTDWAACQPRIPCLCTPSNLQVEEILP